MNLNYSKSIICFTLVVIEYRIFFVPLFSLYKVMVNTESSSEGNANLSFLGSCWFLNRLYLISISYGATQMEIFQSLGKKCHAINLEMTEL